MAVERAPGGSSLIDVLDRILDKGIVIDAWVRISLVGIDLITVEARVVIASIDTYLKYAEAVGITPTVSRPALGRQVFDEVVHAERENQLDASFDLLNVANSDGSSVQFTDGPARTSPVAHRCWIVKPGKSDDHNDGNNREQSPLSLANRFQHREEKGGCSQKDFQ